LKNEGAQGAKLPVGERLHIKRRAKTNNCYIEQWLSLKKAGKTAFLDEKRRKSAQEVAQCCATSCSTWLQPLLIKGCRGFRDGFSAFYCATFCHVG
jgi:hypothetical protein